MITGGINEGKKAEIYIPVTNQSCILPDLPYENYRHVQVGLRACGGDGIGAGAGAGKACTTWNPETGSWNDLNVSLSGSRLDQAWTTEEGTYLIGGWCCYNTTSDLLKTDGSVVPGFNSTEVIRYALIFRCDSISTFTFYYILNAQTKNFDFQ